MYCVLTALRQHFEYVGLTPSMIDAALFEYYLTETKATRGLFAPVVATYIANLAVERGDFRPYLYYLRDDFHDLTTLCAGATDDEVYYVQPELFDYPYLPIEQPCIACDLKSRHAYFTESLSMDSQKLIIMAIQLKEIKHAM